MRERRNWPKNYTSVTTHIISFPKHIRNCVRSRPIRRDLSSRGLPGAEGYSRFVGQASAAASKVLGLFSADELTREPVIAVVNRFAPPVFSTCVGCFTCQTACPYNAIEQEEIKTRDGKLIKTVAKVNSGLCQGCGTCVAFCRSKSIDLQGFSNEQVYAEVMELLS